ncbi:VWA domain-containing protein [Desulfoplanes sp.]
MFRFEHPLFLLTFLLLAAVIVYRSRAGREPVLGVADAPSFSALPKPWTIRLYPLFAAIRYLVAGLLILALAGPQWGNTVTTRTSEGINIVLAVDLSGSMAALDFTERDERVNRLRAVKNVVGDFIQERDGDRIGLVVFGSEAYTQVPLTTDYPTITKVLERVEIGSAGQQTAVGDALGISLKRLQDIPGKTGIVILLTDGRSNAGALSPEDATRIASQEGVKVYTIGVGGTEPAPFIVGDPLFGQRVVYQRVDIDEPMLQTIAKDTSGRYFRANDTDSLANIYATIDKLEKNKVKTKTFGRYKNLYPWFVGPALTLLALWILLSQTRLIRLP